VRPRGTLVLKSTFHGLNQVDLTHVVVDEVTIAGSRCGPFEPALRILEQGLVDVRAMVDRTFPLDRGIEAFEYAQRKGAMKVLIRPDLNIA
jgi:threonine dehydrogenase-like Zn-dependent dehydrogenase